jgi:hypothetical protein
MLNCWCITEFFSLPKEGIQPLDHAVIFCHTSCACLIEGSEGGCMLEHVHQLLERHIVVCGDDS